MAEVEQATIGRVTELFETCIQLHRKSYPGSPLDFDRLNLTGRLKHGTWAHAKGHFADVYKGEMDDEIVVAVKTLRLPAYSLYDEKIYQTTFLRFFREMNHWSKLEHVNVACMVGFTLTGGNVSLVSHWYENGNLVQFLRNCPDLASKDNLMLDVAEGIQYLHTCSHPLIHGDVKGANVLVDENGVAKLTDFGISKQIDDLNRKSGFTTTSGVAGTIPWMAPELELGSAITFSSDIYSCAGVFLEISCPGKVPYYYIPQSRDIILTKDRGEHPQLSYYPELETEGALWCLMCACWEHDPHKRPNVSDVVRALYALFRLSPRVTQSAPFRPPASCTAGQTLTSPWPSAPGPEAFLLGSPKALGWEVDEEEEHMAWRILLADAMEQSIFDRTDQDLRPEAAQNTKPFNERVLWREYLEKWDELRAPLIWKINASLTGEHTWALVPRRQSSGSNGEPQPAIPTAFRRSGSRSICGVSVHQQKPANEDASGLPKKDPEDKSPLETQSIISRPSTTRSSMVSSGSKLPRLRGLRRDSVASLFDAALQRSRSPVLESKAARASLASSVSSRPGSGGSGYISLPHSPGLPPPSPEAGGSTYSGSGCSRYNASTDRSSASGSIRDKFNRHPVKPAPATHFPPFPKFGLNPPVLELPPDRSSFPGAPAGSGSQLPASGRPSTSQIRAVPVNNYGGIKFSPPPGFQSVAGGPREFQCPICHLGFSCLSHLEGHMRVHPPRCGFSTGPPILGSASVDAVPGSAKIVGKLDGPQQGRTMLAFGEPIPWYGRAGAKDGPKSQRGLSL